MLYSSPHARIPLPHRRHLLHRPDRPDRVRDRAADSAVLRPALRRRRVWLRRDPRRVLAEALPLVRATLQVGLPCGTPPGRADPNVVPPPLSPPPPLPALVP